MIFKLSCSSNGSSLGQWARAEQAPKRITPERMPSSEVPAHTVIRPVATGRMTPAWLPLASLPSRTFRKIQVPPSGGALQQDAVMSFNEERAMSNAQCEMKLISHYSLFISH
jgi:hypothetical protein